MKRLIITADDFGLSAAINRSVIRGHQEGVLTAASLMMGEKGAREAIALSRENPGLAVGIHLTLIQGRSVLPSAEIPDLVDREGRFSEHVARSGCRYFFSRKLRRQIEKECRAQVEAFLEAGLVPDHLNGHNHLHIHPAIAPLSVALAKEYQIPAVRVPWQFCPLGMVMAPWVLHLRRLLDKAGLFYNDHCFGLKETGRMTRERWLRILGNLPEGVNEIYCHPGAEPDAFLDPAVLRAASRASPCRGGFREALHA